MMRRNTIVRWGRCRHGGGGHGKVPVAWTCQAAERRREPCRVSPYIAVRLYRNLIYLTLLRWLQLACEPRPQWRDLCIRCRNPETELRHRPSRCTFPPTRDTASVLHIVGGFRWIQRKLQLVVAVGLRETNQVVGPIQPRSFTPAGICLKPGLMDDCTVNPLQVSGTSWDLGLLMRAWPGCGLPC